MRTENNQQEKPPVQRMWRGWLGGLAIMLVAFGVYATVANLGRVEEYRTLKTAFLGHQNTKFKSDVMLLLDGSLSTSVIAEHIKIGGNVLKLHEPFDSRFKVGELASSYSNSLSDWQTKANRQFSSSGITDARKSSQFTTETKDIQYAVENLQESSRADAEKTLVIFTNTDLYDQYKENRSLVQALTSAKLRTSWVTCQHESIGVSCKMLSHKSTLWTNVDVSQMAPSITVDAAEGANIETSVSLRRYPVVFDKPLPIRITIIDKDLVSKIDPESHLYFPGNSYTKKAFHKLSGKVSDKEYHVDIDLEVQSHPSFLQVPEYVEFELRDRNSVPVVTTANAFSLRSDMLAKNIMDWSSDQLKLHSFTSYLPHFVTDVLERMWILPPIVDDLINVCFFGVIGSGKSTTQNTLMTALRTDDYLESMRPIGGGSNHVTIRIEGVDLTQSIKRSNIKMRFWDSFGLSIDNWPDTKFREFLNGRLRSYNVHEDQINSANRTETDVIVIPSETSGVPLKDRIHSVLLFMPAEIFKNDQLFQRMIQASKIAVSEGYNPLLMVTFINEYDTAEREALKDTIIQNFHVPRHQVIFVPFYGDRETRDFKTDFESLYILDRIRNSAESFLESHYPTDQSWIQSIGIRSSIFGLLALLLLIQFFKTIAKVLFFSKTSSSSTTPSSESVTSIDSLDDDDEEDNETETVVVTIHYIQNTMQIRVGLETKLKEILSNVAKTFQVDEAKTVFVDQNGVQYPNEAAVVSCEKIFIQVMTTA